MLMNVEYMMEGGVIILVFLVSCMFGNFPDNSF